MRLFIDTNVLLSFYHFTGDDLEELKKLIVLLEQKKLQLHLPSQVVAEFKRNREVKIADALKRLKDQHLNLQFPQICKDYPHYAKLRELQKQYQGLHTELLNTLTEDIREFSLKADGIISQLFRLAENVHCTGVLIQRARERTQLGNPPGKDGSLGDAVNWEALLASVPDKADLHFITDDKDYCSPLNEEEFGWFLREEWGTKKKSNIVFYKRMSAFFKEHFPDIKLATELEKDLLIQAFANSGSFASTHAHVAKLSKYTDFTPAQLNAIVAAATSNTQISSILEDSDVNEFLSNAVAGHADEIDEDNLLMLNHLLEPSTTADDDDVPF